MTGIKIQVPPPDTKIVAAVGKGFVHGLREHGNQRRVVLRTLFPLVVPLIDQAEAIASSTLDGLESGLDRIIEN